VESEHDITRSTLAWACAASLAAPGLLIPDDAAAAAFGERTLRLHSRGHDVRVLQSNLTRLGFRTAVDGAFGRGTRRSVRRYEQRFDLRVDGRVSPAQARGLRKRVQAHRSTQAETAPATTLEYTDGPTAEIGPDGRTALAPAAAPQAVKDAIAAANRIVDKPYRYGGGHGRWEDSGYDCSGTVSYALHGGGLLNRPRTSGGFETFGRAGKGEWITIYANGGHVYAVIAGLRLDTSGRGESGPRWRPEPRSSRGYVVRHPAGL
jgi:cell wall-associated NlpC family hydrolase